MMGQTSGIEKSVKCTAAVSTAYVIAKFGSENNKDLKWRQIGRDFGIDVKTAQRYFREYKKYLEEQANQNIVDNSSQ